MMIKSYEGKTPQIDSSCFIAETADIIGDVRIGKNSSIWYKAVLRGDDNYIEIGENTNIQDNCVVHISKVYPTIVGDDVTVGHNAILHGCKIGNNTLVGMGAILLDGAEVGENTIIGAGALVPQGMKIPSGVLVLGMPAKVIRELKEEEIEQITLSAKEYVKYGLLHKEK